MPAARVAHYTIGAIHQLDDAVLRVSQATVGALMVLPDPSFTVVTGCGVSQHTVGVLMALDDPSVHVSQHVIGVLFSPATIGEGGTPGGGSSTVSYGFAT